MSHIDSLLRELLCGELHAEDSEDFSKIVQANYEWQDLQTLLTELHREAWADQMPLLQSQIEQFMDYVPNYEE